MIQRNTNPIPRETEIAAKKLHSMLNITISKILEEAGILQSAGGTEEDVKSLKKVLGDDAVTMMLRTAQQQISVDALRGVHQILSHHVGMVEEMIRAEIGSDNAIEVTPLLLKDREKCIKEGVEHSESHRKHDEDGKCPRCIH